MINANIPREWESYVTQTNLGLEVVPAVLYDTLTYTSATTTNLRFFQQTNVARDLSNMKQAGMLSNPEAFLIQNISIFSRHNPWTQAATASASIQTGQFNDLVLLEAIVGQARHVFLQRFNFGLQRRGNHRHMRPAFH